MTRAKGFQQTPVNQWLGMTLVSCSPESVEVEMPVRPEMMQEGGVVQGGILTTLADTAAVYVLWPDLEKDTTMTGTSMSMQFLSAARAEEGPLLATAKPLRIGKTIAVCESCIHQQGRLVAKGTFTFLMQGQR